MDLLKDTHGAPFLPYRGAFGARRPPELDTLPLPPGPMPARDGLRPLKAWRYVGVYGADLMACAAVIRVGRARQSFWALWDRDTRRLHELTSLRGTGLELGPCSLRIRTRRLQLDLRLNEAAGIEAICPAGESYAWTRKQGGVLATGTVAIDGHPRPVQARAVIDDTAAYYPRRTAWQWCAGVGIAADGRELAWNLVEGVNDPPLQSERTVWVAGEPIESPPVRFAPDLSAVGKLRFAAEAVRERDQNLLVLRSRYRQPFGTFSGSLPGGVEVAEGHGVMEAHEALW